MRALKGLLKYIGIVIAIIFALGVVLFGAMYFLPDFRLAGIGVVHANETIIGDPISLTDYSGYSGIEVSVSSKKVPISIVANNASTDINYNMNLSTFGIAFDITEYSVIKDVKVKDGLLRVSLNVTEPDGLISVSSSGLVVTLPESKKFSIVANTENANITLGSSAALLDINNLTVYTISGGLSLVNMGRGAESEKTLSLNSINLSTESGAMNFTSINKVEADKINITSENGEFKFNNIVADMELRGNGVKLFAEDIKCGSRGFSYMSDNGILNVLKLSCIDGAENTILTDTCSVNINELSGKTGIITTSGNVEIYTIHNEVMIQTTHGNVSVKKAEDDISVTTEYGDITIESYNKNGVFDSKRGNMLLNSTGGYVQGVFTKITNVEGSVTLDNNINKVLVTTRGSSKVKITFRNIKNGLNNSTTFENQVVINEKGSAQVYLPTVQAFKFKAKGNISGYLSGLVDENTGGKVVSSEDYQYFPKKESQTEALSSCYFLFEGTVEFNSFSA